MSLNAAQSEAVNTLSGPLLVLAGAGTGKTRVVTQRIARLIKSGIPAERILAVTFTNKAAREMQERAMALCGKRAKKKPWISTFHSLCVAILKRHISRLGYPKRFAIYDRGDQEAAARAALRDIKATEVALTPAGLLAIVSGWKSNAIRPSGAARVAATDQEHLAAAAYRRYQENLKNAAAVDFDDLLLMTSEIFTRFPVVQKAEAGLFDHVMVDEYQDTNGVQYEVVKALAGQHRNLCVVGDDDQSIYSWRGADVRHILRFQRDWPEAKIIRLEENYRSTGPILAMANELIRFNNVRHEKALRTALAGGERPKILQFADNEVEAKNIVEDMASKISSKQATPRDFAVLFRSNELMRPFETELRKASVRYVVIGGQSFFDREEVRDILAYLKAIAYPRDDVSLLRIINKPARGIGRQTVKQFVAAAASEGKPVWEVMPDVAADNRHVAAFRRMLESYRGDRNRVPVSRLIRQLIGEIDYEKYLEQNITDPLHRAARWANIQEVVNAAAAYEQRAARTTLTGFLSEVVLDPRDDSKDKEKDLAKDAVVLSTLHGAKGLEFPFVYLVGLEEGVLPHQKSIESDEIEEERRLCYVGVTRAQQRLTLSFPLARTKWGKPRPTIPSRFLFEMTGQAENFAKAQTAAAGQQQPSGTRKRGKPAKSGGRTKGGRSAKRPARKS